jgi:hypothetical protein
MDCGAKGRVSVTIIWEEYAPDVTGIEPEEKK